MATAAEPLSRVAARPRARRARDPRTGRVALLFTGPFFVLFVLFLFWPVLSALRTSLFDDSLVGGSVVGGAGELQRAAGRPELLGGDVAHGLLHAPQRAAARAARRSGWRCW